MRNMMLLASVIAFILTYSRGAWLGLALGSLLMINPGFSSKTRRVSFLVLGFALVALTIGVTYQPSGRSPLSLSDRQTYLRAGFRILKDHPWRGLGPGNYSSHVFSYLSEKDREFFMLDRYSGRLIGFWQHLHNLYIQMLVDLGLIGFSLWAGALGLLVWKALAKKKDAVFARMSINRVLSASIIAFLIHNLVDIVTVNSFDMVFAVLLATVTFSR